MTLSASAAVDFALNTSTWRPSGLCLQFVDHCYGVPTSNLPPIPRGGVTDARQGWDHSTRRRTDLENAPAGVPIYFPPTANPAGHIVLSIGDGMCVSTDYPSAGKVSVVSVAELGRLRGIPAWGWTEDYLGNDIDIDFAPAPSAPSGDAGGYDVATIQSRLNAHGFATAVDGAFGPDTIAKLRAFQSAVGITVDGIVGPVTWGKLNETPQIAVDGSFGPSTIAALQRLIGVHADGVFGYDTARALQGVLGVAQDGDFGPASTRALQARIGAAADGEWGPATTRALQARLNTGTL